MGRRRPPKDVTVITPEMCKPIKGVVSPGSRKADAILGADLHLWPRAPLCREQDEWLEAMDYKLSRIAELQAQHDAPFLVAGDILEKAFMEKGDQWFFSWLIERIQNWIVIPGQHDLPNHRLEAYPQSNLAVLEKAGVVLVMTGVLEITNFGKFDVTGFPWQAEPRSVGMRTHARHIAMIHRMTYPGKPPYPGAENDGGTAKALMKKMKGFDLIVNGDNHEQFWVGRDGADEIWKPSTAPQLLVNPGSMMRTSAKQIDHEPAVFLWYTDTNTVERVVLPHDKDAVSREHLDRAEAHDERIDAFVESIEGKVDLELSFEDNVRRRYKEARVSQPVVDIVEEAIE